MPRVCIHLNKVTDSDYARYFTGDGPTMPWFAYCAGTNRNRSRGTYVSSLQNGSPRSKKEVVGIGIRMPSSADRRYGSDPLDFPSFTTKSI